MCTPLVFYATRGPRPGRHELQQLTSHKQPWRHVPSTRPGTPERGYRTPTLERDMQQNRPGGLRPVRRTYPGRNLHVKGQYYGGDDSAVPGARSSTAESVKAHTHARERRSSPSRLPVGMYSLRGRAPPTGSRTLRPRSSTPEGYAAAHRHTHARHRQQLVLTTRRLGTAARGHASPASSVIREHPGHCGYTGAPPPAVRQCSHSTRQWAHHSRRVKHSASAPGSAPL